MSSDREYYYHYTTVAGCLSIIKSRSIWLTDYRFLNDKLELRQGLESFLSQIPSCRRKSFELALEWHNLSNHHCVFSLSRSPKILSQWRAYASDGSGMALGFNKTFLELAGISLVECHYEEHDSYAAELISKYQNFVELVHKASELHQAVNSFMDWVRANRAGFYELIRDLIALKNPAFAEEKELRAIWSRPNGDNSIKMREARNLIIPYLEAKIWPDDENNSDVGVVIPEIWLGPKCSELNKTSIYAMNISMCNVYRHDCGYI